MYGSETKRACRARELLFVDKHNRIIIRYNNSLELLNRTFNTASFAVEWSLICKFYAEQLSLSEILIEGYLLIN